MKPICSTAQALSAPLWRRKVEGMYTINAETGCWEWNLALDKNGYGRAQGRMGGRVRGIGAHRASYIAHRGPIPDGLHIDHLCRNRRCVNPDHLEPVTQAENIRRGLLLTALSGRGRVPLHLRPGCLKHGKQEGLWYQKRSGRHQWRCQICNREKARRYRAG